MHRTRPKRAVYDEENVFYSGYRSKFEKQFPTYSSSEWFKMDIPAEQCAVIHFYVPLGKSSGKHMLI